MNVASRTSPLSLQPEANIPPANKPVFSAWDVEPNPSSTATLNLNLVHKLTIKGMKRVTFSMDGKHLAAASSLGVVSIFDTRTGKRIRQVLLHVFSTRP